MLSTPPAPPQRPLPRAGPSHAPRPSGLAHAPGLVSGPGQGPPLLGPLPDTLTEGAGRGSGAGAHCGPDPKRPVFSDGPHAHPAIQAQDSRQRGPSVPDDARVALAWRGPPGAWKGRSAELGLSWSGYGLPLPSLRLWAPGGPACSLWLQRAWASPRSMWRPAQAGQVLGSLPIAGAAAPPQGS